MIAKNKLKRVTRTDISVEMKKKDQGECLERSHSAANRKECYKDTNDSYTIELDRCGRSSKHSHSMKKVYSPIVAHKEMIMNGAVDSRPSFRD